MRIIDVVIACALIALNTGCTSFNRTGDHTDSFRDSTYYLQYGYYVDENGKIVPIPGYKTFSSKSSTEKLPKPSVPESLPTNDHNQKSTNQISTNPLGLPKGYNLWDNMWYGTPDIVLDPITGKERAVYQLHGNRNRRKSRNNDTIHDILTDAIDGALNKIW